MEAIGESLKSYVRESEGITVVAVPNFQGMDGTDVTPKVSKEWPEGSGPASVGLALREAMDYFGSRTEYRNTSWFELKDTLVPKAGISSTYQHFGNP